MSKISSLAGFSLVLLSFSILSGCSPEGRLGGDSLEVSTLTPHPGFVPRVDPSLKEPARAGHDALGGLVTSMDVSSEGSGPKLAENDLALIRVSWTQGTRSGAQWVTLRQGGRPVERLCDEDKLPTGPCTKILEKEPVHLLDAVLRQAFDARRLGAEFELSFGRSQAQGWERWMSEEGPSAGWKSAHYKGIAPREVARETLFVRARLVSACFPKVGIVSTRYKWAASDAASRNSTVMSSCQNTVEFADSK